jgi:hypothetical protein
MRIIIINHAVAAILSDNQLKLHFAGNSFLLVHNMPRLPRTSPISSRLRTSIRRHTPSRTGGASPSSIKKLSVSMLQGYLASYKLPTSGPKQQLIERLINHVRPRTTKERTQPAPQVQSSDSNKSSPSGESSPPNPSKERQSDSPATSDQPSGGQYSQSQSRTHSPPRDRRHKKQRTRNAPLPRSRKRHRTRSPPPRRHRDSSSDSHSSLSPPRCKYHRRAKDSSLSASSLPRCKHHHHARDSSLSTSSLPRRKRHHHARDSSLSSSSPWRHTRCRRPRDSSLSSSSSRRHKRCRRTRDSSLSYSTSSSSSTSINYTHYYRRRRSIPQIPHLNKSIYLMCSTPAQSPTTPHQAG